MRARKTLRAHGQAQPSQDVRYAYNPHGAVVAQERVRLGAFAYQVQEFRNDAYGNVFYSRTRSSASGDEAPSVADYFNDGLLINRNTILPPPGQITQSMVDEELVQEGDGGRVTLTGVLVTIPPVNGGGYASQSGGRQYYTADEKLAVVQRYDYRVGSGASLGSWEEYWYDALGRRILTRARRSGSPPTGTGPLCNDPVGNSCQSYYQRTLWDGDQLLYEWRVADGTATGYNSGIAGYVHVEGIDQPVGLIRSDGTRVINYNWRGLGESSVFTNGAPGDNSITGGSLAVQWPTRSQGGVYFTPNVLASGGSGPFTWFGTLAENGAGSSGLLFRRNRYFDPVSGRFTQADPIGLAGGLNLYGFASGDPVNFRDPFGLSPDTLTSKERSELGDLCNQTDCSRIEVYRGEDGAAKNLLRRTVLAASGGRSVTLGNDIFLGDGDVEDFAILAHETQHVVQYGKWGAAEYLRQGVKARVMEMRGGNPYAYRLNGRSFWRYGMEQQGQIVEDCFRGRTGACWSAGIP